MRTSTLSSVLLITSLFAFSFCASAYAEDDDSAESTYSQSTYEEDDDGVGSTYAQDERVPVRASDRAPPAQPVDYASRIPQQITPMGEKAVIVDPHVHVWGAYDESGALLRAGLASAGSNWCSDLGHPCRTKVGSFRVKSLGGPGCKSSIFPIPRGGAPMPFCMFFNGGQALHGAPRYEVRNANISHGCVRMHLEDVRWLRYNFVQVGTRVIIKPY